ncbi:transglycosylase domain-containing protein [Brevibacterium daeguense]|uniref:Transglycosylase domain-containing protein n=1 Tax=Brevibacterium daeguense TaxID=909936 RepID=A0ABP8EF49_9MICO|nr:transglycosylase domain-containing protein [Brevibacterium daeguense]
MAKGTHTASSSTSGEAGGKTSSNKGLLNYPRAGVTGWTRWLPSLRLLGVAVLAAFVLAIAAFSVGYAVTDIPEPNAEAAGQTSTVFWDDGETPIGTFKIEDRQPVSIDEISQPMQQAAIAAEDQSFYENRGISIKGISRAVWGVITDDYAGGGSTITQQYVKNFYLSNERSLDRKVREMFIAIKIDQEMTKDEVLAAYLNTIYLGRQSYGVEVAAQNYFDKPASELDVSESVLLAAMIQRPGAADPAANPEEYEARFQYVLKNMVELGYLTEDEASAVEMPEINETKGDNQFKGPNGYLLDTVRKELQRAGIEPEQIDRGGLEIVTTYDQDDMAAAVDAIEELPELKSGMHVGLLSIDPATGGVKAMYGGADYLERQQNAATEDTSQTGSAFKPFALVAGFENGFRLTDTFTGNSGVTMTTEGTPWAPRNYGGSNYGPVSLLTATQKSINSAYAQLNIEVGPEKTMDVAVRAGLPEDSPGLAPNAANVLGTANASVQSMTSAYATFASNGIYRAPHHVEKATTPEGEVVYEPDTEGEREFDENVMAETSYALSRVVSGGTGSYAQNLGRPAAGKTGTSQDYYSAWFAGYTPNMATAVSIYREDEAGNPVTIGSYGGRGTITGGTFPTIAWTNYMTKALEGEPVEKFPKRGELPDVEKPQAPENDPGVPKQVPQRPNPNPNPNPAPDQGGGSGGDEPAREPEEEAPDLGDEPPEEEPEQPEPPAEEPEPEQPERPEPPKERPELPEPPVEKPEPDRPPREPNGPPSLG